MKPPIWLLLHAAAAASTEQLFLLVTEPRSGSDWLVDLLDTHPNVCVPAGAWKNSALWVGGSRVNASDGDRASFACVEIKCQAPTPSTRHCPCDSV